VKSHIYHYTKDNLLTYHSFSLNDHFSMSVVLTFSPCTNVSSPISIPIYFVCSIIFCPMLARLNPRSSLSRVSLLHLLRYLACFIGSILCRPSSSLLSRSWNSGHVGPSWLTLVIVLSTPIDHFGAKPYL
jgi:hypothetical protein